MTLKEHLIRATREAYCGDEMSLLCGIYTRQWIPPDDLIPDPDHYLAEEEAHLLPPGWYRSILDILHHVADSKAMYMNQAFGPPAQPLPPEGETLQDALTRLCAAQQYVENTLLSLDETALSRPVPTTCHGDSAAHLFRTLAQHDISHGAQIEVLLSLLRHSSEPAVLPEDAVASGYVLSMTE
jgi:uncharacterized damage-inducible protein DinB